MTRIAVYSDLHYEHGSDFTPPADLRGKIDVVVLAGDISEGRDGIERAKAIAHRLDAPAVYVPGNHEFYDGILEDVIEDLRAASNDEVHVLMNDTVKLDGTRFVGTTLWTDYRIDPDTYYSALGQLRREMNDFRFIKRRSASRNRRKLNPRWVVGLHREQRNWLESALAEPFEGPTVVVTHHAPSARSLDKNPERAKSLDAAAYASDLEYLIERYEPEAWVHGHIHDSLDYTIGSTRVLCNPYGYQIEVTNPEFDPGFTFKV
ncbi:metallophosphoesterase [Parvibaculum sp.]|uniref:metallophosphoesterase n=1 Tax=Parvibaculum sp. TaxID=2024848 RepID=UPI000C8D914D|nr:metallophosphoesterase [Parvibaculum sp.]MAB12703.1 hypothetical protein [Parvibaculum sp.]